MGVTWQESTFRGEAAAEITGYEGAIPDLEIPGELEGRPVRSIAAHAFSDRTDLRSVCLPESLVTLRPFVFYNCAGLKTIRLCNTTEDCYDGVIRQCRKLHEIYVKCVCPENYILIRSLLQDVDGMLTFHLLDSAGEETAQLTFPEYVNEAKEDTMARAIHFSIEGAGMAYRECVGKKKLDFAGYDRLLSRLTEYDFDAAARIAFGRLLYPEELSDKAGTEYEAFLKDNDEKVLEFLIREDEEKSSVPQLRLLTGRRLIGDQGLDAALEMAAEKERTGLCSILMEYRAARDKTEEKGVTFSLDW